MEFTYRPRGVCSRLFEIDVEDGKIARLNVVGGCDGNLKGISRLVTGMDVDEVIRRMEGIDCNGKGTSCPDQIARALKSYQQSHA